MEHLEIERKFLLKSLPSIEPDDKVRIDQFYWKNKQGTWERARTWFSNKDGNKYIHTIKKSISKGVNLENEREMTHEEFSSFKNRCHQPNQDSKFISKERWIYKDGPLKWEVDIFNNGYSLIVAEIELPKKRHQIKFPKFIEEVKLMEVTGKKQFSNRSLSLKINNSVININS